MTDDFFRNRLDQMIEVPPTGGAGQSHALARNRGFPRPALGALG